MKKLKKKNVSFKKKHYELITERIRGIILDKFIELKTENFFLLRYAKRQLVLTKTGSIEDLMENSEKINNGVTLVNNLGIECGLLDPPKKKKFSAMDLK